MPDFRVFCTPADREAGVITLSREESHHLITVNRARRGGSVVAFDGHGAEWTCELANDNRNAAELTVRSRRTAPPLPYAITLAQALPKGPAMDAIVRKATELGAAAIVPLESERTEVHLDGERSDKKAAKWHLAALEAAKQCGNPFLPRILPVQKAAHFMESARGFDLKLIASLQPGTRSLKAVIAAYRHDHQRAPRQVLWLIGPEGDFSPAEAAAAHSAGFVPITLGPLVLRCETAAVCALGVTGHELQVAG
jgi:16S rRNA (uracil1498-N3)-methyltransferase